VRVVLRKALAQAVSKGPTPRGVAEGFKAPQNRSGEMRALNAEQVRRLSVMMIGSGYRTHRVPETDGSPAGRRSSGARGE
jgi:hypothetical protein